MRTILLTQGKVALVDDADFDWLNRRKWCALKRKYTFYAVGWNSETKRTERMHRVILNVPRNRITNHEDGDGLNNQRHNIQAVTILQNQQAFRSKAKNKASKFRGVTWDAARRLWHSQLYTSGKNTFLGRFELEEDAARAYNEAAIVHFGKFAHLNKVS